MKHNRLHTILSAALLALCACQDDQQTLPLREPVTLEASTESSVATSLSTRAILDGEGAFQWETNDVIGVAGQTSHEPFLFVAQERGLQFFSGYATPGDAPRFAYFPYSEQAMISGNKLTLIRPEQSYLSEQNLSPMVSTIQDGQLHFHQTGAVLCLITGQQPKEYVHLRITSSSNDASIPAPLLSGRIVIEDVTHPSCTYSISEGSHTLLYDITRWVPTSSKHKVYIPLQVGQYPLLTFSFEDSQGHILQQLRLRDVNAQRAHLILTPEIQLAK